MTDCMTNGTRQLQNIVHHNWKKSGMGTARKDGQGVVQNVFLTFNVGKGQVIWAQRHTQNVWGKELQNRRQKREVCTVIESARKAARDNTSNVLQIDEGSMWWFRT